MSTKPNYLPQKTQKAYFPKATKGRISPKPRGMRSAWTKRARESEECATPARLQLAEGQVGLRGALQLRLSA